MLAVLNLNHPMKLRTLLFFLFFTSCSTLPKGVYQEGDASWYGKPFHGRATASGESFDMNDMTAAHPRLPFGSMVKVVSPSTGRSVVVRINDRGPFAPGRIIDLSQAAAKKLGILQKGFAPVYLYLLN